MGAAFTTLLSEIVLFAIDYHYTQKIVKYKIDWGIILKLVLISAISIGFAMYLKNVLMANFIILIVITLAYYFALTFIFKVIKLSTIKSLLETKAKTSEL